MSYAETFSPADWLRITVALTALKHKPEGQSLACGLAPCLSSVPFGTLWYPSAPIGSNAVAAAYVLDLRAKFQPLGPLPPSGDKSWREHALHMERQYAALKAEFEAELIKRISSAVGGSAEASNAPASQCSNVPPFLEPPSSDGGDKSKSKKKKKLPQPNEDSSPFASIFKDEFFTPGLIGMDSIFASLDYLHRITNLSSSNEMHISAALLRCVEAVSRELHVVLDPAQHCPSRVKKMELLARTLDHSFHMGLSPLLLKGSRQRLDDVLGAFLKSIALPLIRSFILVSEALTAVFTRPSDGKKETPIDNRYEALELLRASFSSLFASKRSVSEINVSYAADTLHLLETMKLTLVLEILKELYRILCDTSEVTRRYAEKGRQLDGSEPLSKDKDPTLPSKRRREEERFMFTKKLAAKDAFWFLCTLLHSLADCTCDEPLSDQQNLDNEPSGGYDKTSQRMKRAIRDALLNLVVQCQAAQRNSKKTRPISSSKDAQATSRQTDTPSPPTQCPPHPTAMDDQASAVKRSLENADTWNQTVPMRIEEGVVDESAYGMLLGVVERFLMNCI